MSTPHQNPVASGTGINLRGVATIMKEAALVGDDISGAKDPDFESQITPVALGLFRLVVVGEIKRGKSSFINALLGLPGLVPVASDVATSTIFKIRYGRELRYTVFFAAEAGALAREPLVISPAGLAEYGTESGNPRNAKKVEFIGVEAPSPLLRDGLVIVDTPGVGGLFKEHRDITFRHAPKSDAVFFVTDNDCPIGEEEVKFLQELSMVTPLVFFVQTKGDQMEPEERERMMRGNIDIVTQRAGFAREAMRYFVVSSKLKLEGDASKTIEDLQDSGFQPLLDFLNNELKAKKDCAVARAALRRTAGKLDTLESELKSRQQIAEADTDAKRKALEDEIREAERAVASWGNDDRPKLMGEFREELNGVRMDLNTMLQRSIRPMGAITRKMEEKLAAIPSANAIYEGARMLIDDARSEVAHELLAAIRESEQRVNSLIESLALKAGTQIAARIVADSPDGRLIQFRDLAHAPLVSRGGKDGILDLASPLVRGGGVGAALSYAGLIAASILLPPLLPAAAAGAAIAVLASPGVMVIASLWGGWAGLSKQRSVDRARAIAEVVVALNQELADCQLVAQNEFGRAFQRLDNEGASALRKIFEDANRRIAEKQQQIARRRSESQEVGRQARTQLDRQFGAVARVRQQAANVEKLLPV